jgi:hypothetical protein
MTDLVDRLRAFQVVETYENGTQLVRSAHPLGIEAADEIARLRARIAELEETRNNVAAVFIRGRNRTWTGDEVATLIFKAHKMS